MDDVKKIFILINNLDGGGAERQVSYLSELEIIDKIICIDDTVNYATTENKVHCIYSRKKLNNKAQKIIHMALLPFKLKSLGVDKNTTLICFLQLSIIMGVIAKFLFRCKLIITIRTNPTIFYKVSTEFKLPLFIYKRVLMYADSIISNSELSAIETEKLIKGKKVSTIANGYRQSEITELSNKNEGYDFLFKNKKVLINVGRLHADKGQWHLIRILGELKKENRNIILVFIGKGPLLDKYIELCSKYDLRVYNEQDKKTILEENADVYFLGFQKNPYYFIKNSQLFVFPSIFEGLPNTPIEALMCSTPIMLADCKSGPREILLPGSNLLETTDIPIETYGSYLMPTFEGTEIFDNQPLISVEKIWYESILKALKNLDMAKPNNGAELIKKYPLEVVLVSWESYLNRFTS